jgi:flagellar hook-associated protein 3 FlgL
MRVTQSMIANNFLNNLSNSYKRLDKYMEQAYTGKKVSRPSDDPVVAMKGMNYRTELTEIQQYQRNLGEIHTWMDNSDDALDKATLALQRIRELAVQASNGTYEEGQRANIAEEVKQLKEHLISIANTKVNNKYIFNGTDTTNAPVEVDANGNITKVSTNTEPVNITVSDGVKLQANITAPNVFSQDMFDKIQQFIDDLESGVPDADLDAHIGSIDEVINTVVDERANLGARMNRLEMVEDRLSSQEVVASKILSDNEDVDFEKVIMQLKTQESIHRAALSVGARVIQPTLIDFLR